MTNVYIAYNCTYCIYNRGMNIGEIVSELMCMVHAYTILYIVCIYALYGCRIDI